MKNKQKEKKFQISKDEWLVIGAIFFAALTLIFILPKMMDSIWFTSLVPPFQYLAFNLGFILLTIVMFGIPTTFFLKQKINFWMMLRGGIGSWLIFSFMLDLWQPPFAFSVSGRQIISDSGTLVGTSVDCMLGWIYIHILPFQIQDIFLNLPIIGKISLLFMMIYFFTPIISVTVAAFLFKPGILIDFFKDKSD
ncbi:MAG: hypothetical protein NT093_03610 [Candidatus Moranbacteria bacterium]|nr:hypothetical protein [Candidatus Moranbacteria bacterium]